MKVTKEAYEQNYQQFRSLNQIMWQIPVLAMTLTGGLWFGVSTIDNNAMLVTILLLTAVMGNVMLCGVLVRFRHVMGCYLDWLKAADRDGFVDASLMSENGRCPQTVLVPPLFFCANEVVFEAPGIPGGPTCPASIRPSSAACSPV